MQGWESNLRLKNIYQSKYSKEYLNAVQMEVKTENPLLAVSSQQDSLYIATGNPFEPSIASYLTAMTTYNSVTRLCYAVDSLNKNTNLHKQSMANFNPFTRFINEQKNNGTYISTEHSKIDFVKANHIRYLIVEPGATPDPVFAPYIAKKITDNISGESFVELKF
ncbi:MAG: hypothetical protein ACLQQ4_03125 [Bacteroidia bacterium]